MRSRQKGKLDEAACRLVREERSEILHGIALEGLLDRQCMLVSQMIGTPLSGA